jgi:cytochrome c556
MKKLVASLAALALFASTPALSKPKKTKKDAEVTPATAVTPAPEAAPAPEPEAAPGPDVAPEIQAVISYRHTQMKLAGGHMKSVKLIVKSGVDAQDEILQHTSALQSVAANLSKYWPEGSGHETGLEDLEAKAEIWTDAEGFAAELTAFHEATQALHKTAEGGDNAAIIEALGNVGAQCGSCHDVYRD